MEHILCVNSLWNIPQNVVGVDVGALGQGKKNKIYTRFNLFLVRFDCQWFSLSFIQLAQNFNSSFFFLTKNFNCLKFVNLIQTDLALNPLNNFRKKNTNFQINKFKYKKLTKCSTRCLLITVCVQNFDVNKNNIHKKIVFFFFLFLLENL